MRRPVRFFVHDINYDQTIWLDDHDGEESSVVDVKRYDAMGHGRHEDGKLRVIVMQLGRDQDASVGEPTPTTGEPKQ